MLLLGAAFAYAQTSLGKQQIGGVIERTLSAPPARQATVEGIAGLIPFDVRIGKVRLADDKGPWLEVDNARVTLSPTDLLAGRIFIKEAGAERVRVDHVPASPPPSATEPASPSQPFSLPKLPQSLPAFAAEQVYVSRLELGQSLVGQEAVFKLDGGARTGSDGKKLDAKLDLVRTDQATADAHLATNLDLSARQMSLKLQANESGGLLAGITHRPEAGTLHVDLDGNGPFSGFKAKLQADAQNLATLTADLDLAVEGAPRLDMTGKLAVADGVLPVKVSPLVGRELAIDIQAGQRSPNLFAAEKIDIHGGGFSVAGQGTAQLDARTIDGKLTVTLPALVAASDLAGKALAGKAGLVVTAAGQLYQPDVKVELTGADLAADDIAVGHLGTTLDVAFLGPLDQGYAGVGVTGQGGADGVTLKGEPIPLVAAPRWELAAKVPAQGQAVLDHLQLTADPLTAKLTAAIDQGTKAGNVHLDVDAPDLARIVAALGPSAPQGIAAQGAVKLGTDAKLDDQAKHIAIDLAVDCTGLAGLPPGAQELVGATPKLTAKAVVAPNEEARLEALSLNGAAVTLDGKLRAGLAPADRGLSGDVTLSLPQLAALSAAAHQPIAGKAQAKIGLAGTLDEPALTIDAVADGVQATGHTFQKIALTGKAAGPPADLGGDARLALTQPEGELALSTAYRLQGKSLALKVLRLQGPATNLGGDLDVDLATLGATGNLKGGVSDLGALKPWSGQALSGSVDLTADLSAPDGRQNARAHVAAKGIAGDFGQLASLALDATATDARGDLGLIAKASLQGFRNPGMTVETANLAAEGALADMRLTGDAKGDKQGPFNLATRARLRIAGDRKSVELSSLNGTFAGQSIELRAPAMLSLDQGVLDLDQLDLRVGQARIQGQAQTNSGRLRASANVTQFPLAMLASFGAPALGGTANATLQLNGPLAAPRGDLSLSVPDLRVNNGLARDFPAAALDVKARVGDGRASADVSLANLTAKPVTASAAVPLTLSLSPFAVALPREGALSGRLDAKADLARIVQLAALDGQRAKGPLDASFQLSGTLAAPLVNGRLTVGPATFEDAISGVAYSDLRLNLVADGRRIAVQQLTATSRGNGRITGTGDLTLAADGTLPYRLQTTLRNAEVMRNDLGQVAVSGDIGLTGDSAAAAVKGKIELQRADIEIPSASGPRIPTLDVTVAGQGIEPGAGPTAAPPSPFQLGLDVAVSIPARLFVRGRGLISSGTAP